jgi:L-seryl-tRNA(Ser) seleniumtransferase
LKTKKNKIQRPERKTGFDESVFPPVQQIEQWVSADHHIDRPYIIRLIRQSIQEFKKRIFKQNAGSLTREQITTCIAKDVNLKINKLTSFRMKRIINGTGVILHTGLGRAPLSIEAIRHLNEVISNYCNLEIDLESGERGDRHQIVEELLCLLTGAESACVVNNNTAAVMIVLNSLAYQKEAIVSRGQLIEIGGSFRLPEVMEKSGVIIRETGTTNKTHLKDYQRAVNKNTGLILFAHTSNYRIMGFTHEVALSELARMSHEKKIPLVYDLGGGVMTDLAQYQLPHEPVVREAVQLGADVITFSGDKLLGACQSGLIVGKKKYIQLIKRNPLMRALRCDKITYAVLEATLKLYLQESALIMNHPALKSLTVPVDILRQRAEQLQSLLAANKNIKTKIIPVTSQAGSGTLPLENIPSIALIVSIEAQSAVSLSRQLRLAKVPVIGYIKNNRFHLDMRTIRDDELTIIHEMFRPLIEPNPCTF